MVDRIRYPTVSYLPFYYVFFQFLLVTIFNLQANILTTKDILSNLASPQYGVVVPLLSLRHASGTVVPTGKVHFLYRQVHAFFFPGVNLNIFSLAFFFHLEIKVELGLKLISSQIWRDRLGT